MSPLGDRREPLQNAPDEIVQRRIATVGDGSEGLRDDSGTIPGPTANPRQRLIEVAAGALQELIAGGDVEAVRAASELLARLHGAPAVTPPPERASGEVVDLAARRQRKPAT